MAGGAALYSLTVLGLYGRCEVPRVCLVLSKAWWAPKAGHSMLPCAIGTEQQAADHMRPHAEGGKRLGRHPAQSARLCTAYIPSPFH